MIIPLHQYLDRESGDIRTETLCADSFIHWMYFSARENAHWLFNALTSSRFSKVLAWLHYDIHYRLKPYQIRHIFLSMNIDPEEIADDVSNYHSLRNIFERKIRYWECRPMPLPEDLSEVVVSPCDARVVIGSFSNTSVFFIKDKFFDFTELIGIDKPNWLSKFSDGDTAIFRLTPDKYHYNHAPVSGIVEDVYEISGRYHSCNPGAVVQEATPFSKNRRVITVINTDTADGTGVGYVAMIEIAAMMIGDIVPCYSDKTYDNPYELSIGMAVRKGQPKSLYRPGSSTTVLLFEKNHVQFSEDIRQNTLRQDVLSRYSMGFGSSLVETDIRVRSEIARRI